MTATAQKAATGGLRAFKACFRCSDGVSLPAIINTPPKRSACCYASKGVLGLSKLTHRQRPKRDLCWCRWTQSPGTTVSCFDMVCHLMVALSEATLLCQYQLPSLDRRELFVLRVRQIQISVVFLLCLKLSVESLALRLCSVRFVCDAAFVLHVGEQLVL